MNRSAWYVILALLIAGTVFSFFYMRHNRLAARKIAIPEPRIMQSAGRVEKTEKHTQTEEEKAASGVRPDYQLLYQKTLFRNSRTEGDGQSTTGQPADQLQAEQAVELIGIARIGRKDQATAVAIIQELSSFRNANRQRTPANARQGNRTVAQKSEAPTKTANHNVFKVGDTIGNTGYRLKEIRPQENAVVLTRSGIDITLKIDVKNTKNSARREAVKKEALSQQTQNRQNTEKLLGTPVNGQPQKPTTGAPQDNRRKNQGTPQQRATGTKTKQNNTQQRTTH